ncbi:hypothetical protein KIN20_028180 [Parelaphostrongylus tenuis]|uniref:Uncharacterized protein n=1 Tax=Parelaphostrongylus tenuis TaxID=148309 RepID=A0AAD5WEJ8_PARTN|nr:hypothetical protein KIN20_028180 [Parelaphostrongylus tenuis]
MPGRIRIACTVRPKTATVGVGTDEPQRQVQPDCEILLSELMTKHMTKSIRIGSERCRLTDEHTPESIQEGPEAVNARYLLDEKVKGQRRLITHQRALVAVQHR